MKLSDLVEVNKTVYEGYDFRGNPHFFFNTKLNKGTRDIVVAVKTIKEEQYIRTLGQSKLWMLADRFTLIEG